MVWFCFVVLCCVVLCNGDGDIVMCSVVFCDDDVVLCCVTWGHDRGRGEGGWICEVKEVRLKSAVKRRTWVDLVECSRVAYRFQRDRQAGRPCGDRRALSERLEEGL